MLPNGYRDAFHTYTLVTKKQKTPTKTKPNNKASSKTPRHSEMRHVEKPEAG
jgi:hypothetical protein